MREQIYTIPVNEAFESEDSCCPICALYKKLEENELDLIMGASMMEPDVRIETNKKGFCRNHFLKMLPRKNRLSLALMLESHLPEVKSRIASGSFLAKDAYARTAKGIGELEESCYICQRIEYSLSRMIETVIILFEREAEFRAKYKARKYFCLPHYKRLITDSKKMLSKQRYAELAEMSESIVNSYLDSLVSDVSWFCKKFDYRYDSEPWGNAKDSIERTIKFLAGE